MEIKAKFKNKGQREFYFFRGRNQCFSGGFNNGKTYIGCLKAITLLLTFPAYRIVIARLKYVDLKRTTMQTFFSLLPAEIIQAHNEQDGVTQLKNGSLIYWMHLDNVQESSIRGLEPNSILIDQAEEISEKSYDLLNSRVGRWAGSYVPQELLDKARSSGVEWPVNFEEKPLVPSYLMCLVNPDTQFHFIYRKYHPESLERRPEYEFTEGEWDPELGSTETYAEAIRNDPEWVAKYVKGQWGISSSQIHRVSSTCFIEYSEELYKRIQERGNLYRILDHGESAPTCCLWMAVLDGIFIFYREYYVPGKVISYHRQGICDLSEGENYAASYADPAIFKKSTQKDGNFWSVADEYRTTDLPSPPLFFIAADNNEFATRNRISELLLDSKETKHPISGELNSPRLYFIKRSEKYPYGCEQAIKQLGAQRKVLLGTFDGKSIYSDERDKAVTDHAYDCVRYAIAMHGQGIASKPKRISRNTFDYYRKVMDMKGKLFPRSVS